MSARRATFSKRHLMAQVPLVRPSPSPPPTASKRRWNGGGLQHPKRRLWLASNQSENYFPHPGVDPAAEMRASSIFCSFASHALQAYTVGDEARLRRASVKRRSLARYCDRAIYVRSVWKRRLRRHESGINAEENGVKTAMLTTENYCWILRRRMTDRRRKHAIIAR